MDDVFVTMREAAEILGVSNQKIWRLVRDGDLTAYANPRDRRYKLIRRTDLDALMEVRPLDGRRKKPAPPEEGPARNP